MTDDDRLLPNYMAPKGEGWPEKLDPDQAERIRVFIENRMNSQRFRKGVRRDAPGADDSDVIAVLFSAALTAGPSWTEEHADDHAVQWVKRELLPKGHATVSLDEELDYGDEPISRHDLISGDIRSGPGSLTADSLIPGNVRPSHEPHTNPWHGQPAHWEHDPVTGKREWHPAAPDLPDLPMEKDLETGRWQWRIPLPAMWKWLEERGEAGLTSAEREVIGMRDGQELSWNEIAKRRRPVTSKQNQMFIYRRGKAKLERP